MSEKDEGLKESVSKNSDKRQAARRRLLGTLVAGGAAGAALPSQWKKPVIDAVMLPAHAQTTGVLVAAGGGTGTASPGPAPQGTPGEGLLDFFVGPAQAVTINEFCLEIDVEYSGTTPKALYVTKLCDFCPKPSRYDLVFSGNRKMNGEGSWNLNINGYQVKVGDVRSLPEGETEFPDGAIVAEAEVEGTRINVRSKGSCNCNCPEIIED